MEIKEIGIVGSGTMAGQIAELFLKHNYSVTMFSRTEESAEKCRSRFRLKELAEKMNITTNMENLKDKDLIIESVKEDTKIKQEIFEKLDVIARDNAIISSNTSSVPISLISKNCKNKKRILGIHFSNPAAHMKLVEIVKTDFVSGKILDSAIELMRKIGKEPMVVKDTAGFILNRILFPMLNDAANLFYEGAASREDIDKAMVLGALHPAGPLKIIDIVGVDVTVSILKNLQSELRNGRYAPSPILLKMLKENNLGRKTGKGFYEYQS